MTPLVTIGVPIYKRLHFLKNVLNVVRSQDYPAIELLVSDNGMNGQQVRRLVDQYYSGPFKFRQNVTTVSISTHFNQIVQEASGDYIVLLADDDEISPNYVSTLVKQLERYPQASLAMSIQETIDEAGILIRTSKPSMPEILSGFDFIRAVWGTHQFAYESLSTFLAKTKNILACGGYPDFWKGHGNDDALLIKLCLDNYVALNKQCRFRKRFDESSHGFAAPIQDLAHGIRDFLRFVDHDSTLKAYAGLHALEWSEVKRYLSDMAWKTYYYRWTGLYRNRLSSAQWVRAAFALPYIPAYYRAVGATFAGAFVSSAAKQIRMYLPVAYDVFRAAKSKYQRAGQ
jgi:glycosyltransferase involved in cell wall biosynthesis